MTEQQHTPAQSPAEEALAVLEQAWAYYTPEKQPELDDNEYIDLPVAA
ncbi:hypothetical protein roselon_01719 [Roseibacterium elongatum DSM 19469]|uniref:Uncharacterized protein n=1 Tax=Roseicyclus elongatus DSM 19469 TaxID=1294273 RepID=W8S5H7_9RHOB|nr:hypothetical protein [Roseibacterium elongatum]AHM04086.1 hypothetical protein roselon_01719 [Roseibacterium elongatum DSM 19469]